jgi:hypothetical protein
MRHGGLSLLKWKFHMSRKTKELEILCIFRQKMQTIFVFLNRENFRLNKIDDHDTLCIFVMIVNFLCTK